VDSARVTYERAIPDLGIGTAAGTAPPKLIRAVRIHLKPGAADGFIDLAKSDLMPGLKKAGVSWSRARRVEYGGSRNDITVSTGIDKLADLDTDLLAKALGPDGARKYLEKTAQFVNGAEYLIYRRLDDLSYAGKQP
jgi:hypothetical protein